MFVSIRGHGQWSVGDVKSLALVGFKGQKESSGPMVTLDDGSDAAGLTSRVGYRQALSLKASHSTSKIDHLETDSFIKPDKISQYQQHVF